MNDDFIDGLKNYFKICGIILVAGFVGSGSYFVAIHYGYIPNPQAELAKKGEYYSTQCQLIETNIDNGLFQPNTNKLKCGDVIHNVSVEDYQDAVIAYQESERKNEK